MKAATKKAKDPATLEISKDVLVGIASIALEGIKGVTPVNPPISVGEVLTGKRLKDINVTRNGDSVSIDISLNIDYGRVIPEVAKEVQRAVSENVQVMTGLTVQAVNVVVQGVSSEEAA